VLTDDRSLSGTTDGAEQPGAKLGAALPLAANGAVAAAQPAAGSVRRCGVVRRGAVCSAAGAAGTGDNYSGAGAGRAAGHAGADLAAVTSGDTERPAVRSAVQTGRARFDSPRTDRWAHPIHR